MPLYDFVCPNGHVTEHLLKAPVGTQPCPTCGMDAERQMAAAHVPPDGVYSYAPNIGDQQQFERRYEEAMKRRQECRDKR